MTASRPAGLRLPHWFRERSRLISAAVIGLLAYGADPAAADGELRVVIAWDAGLIAYFTLIAVMMIRATPARMKARARLMDIGDGAIMVLVVLGITASFVSISNLLQSVHGPAGASGRGLAFGLAAITIIGVWALLHTVFAVHYAHRWYAMPERGRPLVFPGDDQPSPLYGDFLYFSFVIGMTAQVSDVVVTGRPMRRAVLVHSILSFLFNTVILAFAINISASLVG